MKTILFFLLATAGICYAQMIPYKATLTASKDSVLSDETFTVTYSLTNVKGYVYIGVQNGYFETIGKDRWEGEIKVGETKTIIFTVKLKERAKAGIQRKVPLSVGFSYKPFGERIGEWGEFDGVIIKIIDYKKPKYRFSKDTLFIKKNDSSKIINRFEIIQIKLDKLLDQDTNMMKNKIKIDTTSPRLYFPGEK